MKPEFTHYWQGGVILNEEGREHQRKIMQAMNQDFVYTVSEDSPLNGHVSTVLSKRELEEMMLREHDTPSHLMPFFLATKTKMKTQKVMNLLSIYATENLPKQSLQSF